ncbi:hypothetical protein NQ314_010430 [Rhamnusium bicolor]|uniref:Ral GTPase-activating protein subunit alpha/beta N-terminal domain-containing protein n=1 Tax=Rhamnusium bicolor TaxID=1586634 RepID=A0AAV8XQQ9_9CUCU|nr:hypothetical protein NQ314_010430 [Rhamnusium bicolor]
MFTKRNLVDVKKSTAKLQDPKKDVATRIKHLKIILDNVDIAEAKGLFEANFSHIYNILYESFVQTEGNLRQRVHKAHKEELECTLWILDQVLCLLPELLHRRWQCHSLGRLLAKLLHPGNAIKLRRQGIRYFLMWYQALNENAPEYVHSMFAALVPGFHNQYVLQAQSTGSVFHDTSAQNPVTPTELLPILPPSSGEKPPDHPSKFYLEALLEYIVLTVVKLEWQDKSAYHHRCFNFLLEKFKYYYLPKICPNFCEETSLYRPNLELPVLRRLESETEYVHCRVTLIMWVANYMHQTKKNNEVGPSSIPSIQSPSQQFSHEEEPHDSSHPSLDSRNVIELPSYALELPEDVSRVNEELSPDNGRPGRLRNDSYLGAIHKENLLVRAGMQNLFQLFMTHAANAFLLEINSHIPRMLEEQTDTCKRVLNIYRYMVMNTRMDNSTWEQLLLVLLQITSLVLGENPPKKKVVTLGGKLAPAIFQTLIVTWIKANLNVMISRELWDRFLHVLTSLTNWEELIKEWAKTLETLTRVLARHVYNLDLTDLPLDRLTEPKAKRGRRGPNRPENSTPCSASDAGHPEICRQDSSLPDGHILSKRVRSSLPRSYSETSLTLKRRSTLIRHHNSKQRRSRSLDTLSAPDTESTDRTRSPSPAPSSGLESNSMKDSPIQLEMLSSENHTLELSGENRGVICGGAVRGWLPDVAVILWRRMLGALGDINQITDPKLHAQVLEYLVKLTDTLIKIKHNQGVSHDNMSTPQAPELVPPLTLILPWCFGSLILPDNFEAGKLNALRLLSTPKEHVVSILLRAGRREPKGKARCIALSALGMFVYKELNNQTFHSKVADAINVLLLALKFNNKVIAQLTSNILFLLCDHAPLLWNQYPRLGNAVIRTPVFCIVFTCATRLNGGRK